MATTITVKLSDDVLHRAELIARRVGRPVDDFLAEAIELSIRPLGTSWTEEAPLSDWPDEEILAAADSEMPSAEDQRLSELLDRQQAGSLTGTEHAELAALLRVYQEGLLRKAQALREGVRRGLREPLQP